jgi:hypothetical protein
MTLVTTTIENLGKIEGSKAIIIYDTRKYRYTIDFYFTIDSEEPDISYFGIEPAEVDETLASGIARIRSYLAGGLPLVWVSPDGDVSTDFHLSDKTGKYVYKCCPDYCQLRPEQPEYCRYKVENGGCGYQNVSGRWV